MNDAEEFKEVEVNFASISLNPDAHVHSLYCGQLHLIKTHILIDVFFAHV